MEGITKNQGIVIKTKFKVREPQLNKENNMTYI